ncbi:MAC/Perforin domain-containing protein [Oopsacas minuta]|uniref:MAC/Perforin domain-containing protein n=1 Tax=Oopsacas minuta TaxID=111878 RepID=A0AAV7KC60_9METZ|nr:MAC/Perforin domain-containing protein [Oopsacas minuta]
MQTILLTIFVSLLVQRGYSDDTPPLGQGYFIPKHNLLGEQLLGGQTLLDMTADCWNCVRDEGTYQKTDVYTNTERFYRSLTSTTSLSPKLETDFTLGATLDITSNGISGGVRNLTGVSLNDYTTSLICFLKSVCLSKNKLNIDFQKDFEALNPSIKEPWLESNWVDYETFYNKYGSHFITEVAYGARFYEHAFSDARMSYTSRNLTVRACAALAGPAGIGILEIEACEGINKQEIDSVSSLAIYTLLVIRGGTAKTRAELYKNRTVAGIAKFMSEANATEMPIKYNFMPIWSLLQLRYLDTEHYSKARNLAAYYLGFGNYGCEYQPVINTSKFKVEYYQRFEYAPTSTDSIPTFQCVIAPQGCHADTDCHKHDIIRCSCHGDSCIRHFPNTLDTSVIKKVARPNYDIKWGAYGCGQHLLKCSCDNMDWGYSTVWQQDKDTDYPTIKS